MIYLLLLLLGCNLFWIMLFRSRQRLAEQNAKQITDLALQVKSVIKDQENLVIVCHHQMAATVYLVQIANTWKQKYFELQDAYLGLIQNQNLKVAKQLDN